MLLTIATGLVFGFVLPDYSGDREEDDGEELLAEISAAEKIFAWVSLVSFPIAVALVTIMNRLLKELHENTTSSYANGSQLIIYGIIVLCMGKDVTFWLDYTALMWILMIGCSICQVCSQTFNFMAS